VVPAEVHHRLATLLRFVDARGERADVVAVAGTLDHRELDHERDRDHRDRRAGWLREADLRTTKRERLELAP